MVCMADGSTWKATAIITHNVNATRTLSDALGYEHEQDLCSKRVFNKASPGKVLIIDYFLFGRQDECYQVIILQEIFIRLWVIVPNTNWYIRKVKRMWPFTFNLVKLDLTCVTTEVSEGIVDGNI